jgi:hypothetical protein
MGMFRNVRVGTNHEHQITPHQRRVKRARRGVRDRFVAIGAEVVMQRRRLGARKPEIGSVSLGCMRVSDFWVRDGEERDAAIRASLELGETFG